MLIDRSLTRNRADQAPAVEINACFLTRRNDYALRFAYLPPIARHFNLEVVIVFLIGIQRRSVKRSDRRRQRAFQVLYPQTSVAGQRDRHARSYGSGNIAIRRLLL